MFVALRSVFPPIHEIYKPIVNNHPQITMQLTVFYTPSDEIHQHQYHSVTIRIMTPVTVRVASSHDVM